MGFRKASGSVARAVSGPAAAVWRCGVGGCLPPGAWFDAWLGVWRRALNEDAGVKALEEMDLVLW